MMGSSMLNTLQKMLMLEISNDFNMSNVLIIFTHICLSIYLQINYTHRHTKHKKFIITPYLTGNYLSIINNIKKTEINKKQHLSIPNKLCKTLLLMIANIHSKVLHPQVWLSTFLVLSRLR